MEKFIETNPGEYAPFISRKIAHEEVDKELWYKRILDLFEENINQELSVREVATLLYLKGQSPNCERQTVAPRITELSQRGLLEANKIKMRDDYTGKTVAVYHLTKNYKYFYKFLFDKSKPRKKGE